MILNQDIKPTKLETGYKPRPLQSMLHSCDARFVIAVMHRRFGKTVCEANHHIHKALPNPLRNPQYAYVGPSYKEVKRIAWQYFVDYTRNIPGVDPVSTELTVKIHRDWHIDPISLKLDPDTIKLMLIGADDPDSLRGIYLDGGTLDEFAQIDPILWGQIIRPALADRAKIARELAALCPNEEIKQKLLAHKPWAHFIGTPKGQNHFYRRFIKSRDAEEQAKLYTLGHNVSEEIKRFTAIDVSLEIYDDTPMEQIEKKLASLDSNVKGEYLEYRKYLANKEWKVFVCKASQTGILSRDEIESMIEDMDKDEVAQELECSFEAAIKGSYFGSELSKIDENGQIGKVPYNPRYPVNTFWDLGVNDKNSIWFVQKTPTGWDYIDYHEDHNMGFVGYLKIISEKPYLYGKHIWPHDGTQREYISGKKRKDAAEEMGQEFGFKVDIQQRTFEVDQIEAARSRIPVSRFDREKCSRGLECLYNYQKKWDSKLQCYSKNAVHDWSSNGSKAFMYSALDDSVYSFAKDANKDLQSFTDGVISYDEFS